MIAMILSATHSLSDYYAPEQDICFDLILCFFLIINLTKRLPREPGSLKIKSIVGWVSGEKTRLQPNMNFFFV
jgi:hypothetical protein